MMMVVMVMEMVAMVRRMVMGIRADLATLAEIIDFLDKGGC